MADAERALKPANENPWYVLMTLYGEQDGQEVDEELHEKNRAAWNAWSCQAMSDEERAKAAASSEVTVAELSDWLTQQNAVTKRHKAEMLRRNGEGFAYPGLPDGAAMAVDLQRVVFTHRLAMRGAVFSGEAWFFGATFSGATGFNLATFSGGAWFVGATFSEQAGFGRANFSGQAEFGFATFSGEAEFGRVRFSGDADFRDSTFSGDAAFYRAIFSGEAGFYGAIFSGEAGFYGATFSGEAGFGEVAFSGKALFDGARFSGFTYFSGSRFGAADEHQWADFTDCQFEKPTSFSVAVFHSRYPDFAGAVLHGNTTFTDVSDHWPNGAQSDPVQAKASCAVIRHNLGKQGLPEAEHFFFRREMGFAGQIGGWWERLPYRLFGAVSDYGYSIARPATCLFWVWFLPMLVFTAFRVTGVPVSDIPELLWSGALSFANLFPLFGFHRVWFDADKLAMLSPWMKALSGVQTVLSLPLLFFLGLGLRTRFRMR